MAFEIRARLSCGAPSTVPRSVPRFSGKSDAHSVVQLTPYQAPHIYDQLPHQLHAAAGKKLPPLGLRGEQTLVFMMDGQDLPNSRSSGRMHGEKSTGSLGRAFRGREWPPCHGCTIAHAVVTSCLLLYAVQEPQTHAKGQCRNTLVARRKGTS